MQSEVPAAANKMRWQVLRKRIGRQPQPVHTEKSFAASPSVTTHQTLQLLDHRRPGGDVRSARGSIWQAGRVDDQTASEAARRHLEVMAVASQDHLNSAHCTSVRNVPVKSWKVLPRSLVRIVLTIHSI